MVGMESMSKIAQYLNEHILGEITGSKSIRQRFSRDGSVLTIMPELVMFPRVTNDIRKAARFSWQLAEKGHTLPLTVRGYGSDPTGAAIGKGLIINTTAHLNNIIHIGLKEKEHTVHVQPGVNFKELNDILNWHGLYVPTYPESAAYSTIGGAVANNSGGQLSGRAGLTGNWVGRLEVVLANGDIIETGRLSKKEFSKKRGLQTFEGEIYRKIDGLIEDNQELINEKLHETNKDNSGYARINDVRHRDGSFDLTPLIVGSQGTLGIISEIVLKTDFLSANRTVLVAVVGSSEAARDATDLLRALEPSSLETIDGAIFKTAAERGKQYAFMKLDKVDIATGALIYMQLTDFNNRARTRKLKKAIKTLQKFNPTILTSDEYSYEELDAMREVMSNVIATDSDNESYPPLIDGVYIPSNRFEEFSMAVNNLAEKHHITLPLHRRVLDGIVNTRTSLQLDKVSDKQKIFKLINDYSQLVDKLGGTFIADAGEGRLKASASYALMDENLQNLYQQIRVVFDPYGTLNPGVKQPSDVRTMVAALRSSYDQSDFALYSPRG